ncbi:MAG TPA: hypothetical protein VL282_10570 [Tepidisphaeraceae bacterium]|nr:hypothetical protein [Tepidisphaeraceae bacterium]
MTFLMLFLTACTAHKSEQQSINLHGVPSLEEAINSNQDVWGEAALKQPGGPSYEFFAALVPQLRYVDAPFRHYPMTLSAPEAAEKVRFVSNGSQINALARQPNWTGETGIPTTFRVGYDLATFGDDLSKLQGPVYENGYLPVVQNRYTHDGSVYTQEAFAAVDPKLAENGVAFVRVGRAEGTNDTKIEVQFESAKVMKLSADKNMVIDADGKVIAAFEAGKWEFNAARTTLTTYPKAGESAVLAIYTKPVEEKAGAKVDSKIYDEQHQQCIDTWNKILASGTTFQTPEKRVNDAWRANVIGNIMLIENNEMRYSQGNQYAKQYIGEGGDATRAMALFGQTDIARKVMPNLFIYTRKNLEFHQAGFKLQLLAHYYFLTGDAAFVKSLRTINTKDTSGRTPGWETELNVLLNGREKDSGLYPPEKYAGDPVPGMPEMVYSLNSNANGWRGMRDMAIVLDAIGEKDLSQKAAQTAAELRKAVLAAIDKSIDRHTVPPFVPVALFGVEKPYDTIINYRSGSYYNIIAKYVLGSGVFPANSETATDIIQYMQQHGGICMGLNRNLNAKTWWLAEKGINDLYNMRYALALTERDDVDQALVSFYGKLAQGFTKDTYIDGEGSSLTPLDQFGRQTYLPPNSCGNASYMQQLRYLLVQDYDTNEDGKADTLRLAFATPRAWLKDGQTIEVAKAPTQFGEVSYTISSKINGGVVTALIELPDRTPGKALLRLRLPENRKIKSATTDEKELAVTNGDTIDLTGLKGTINVHASVGK